MFPSQKNQNVSIFVDNLRVVNHSHPTREGGLWATPTASSP